MPEHTYTNRLIDETSPYLLQHAHNPVNWYPWGEEALALAKRENKPILLSVGYSACHWCHVMERESFENPEIAALMNRFYINIKVDREERPDVDAIYMTVVQMLTGQGGWPMTVFLTSEGKPFYGGTYYPPSDMYGRPGFPRLLTSIAEMWETRRQEIEEQSSAIVQELDYESLRGNQPATEALSINLLDTASAKICQRFDTQFGGFGNAPKFPQPDVLLFLLKTYARNKSTEVLEMVEKTLHGMALGGMYDQLGGGFHRYSTDAAWLVPHFEKMLYDNAQLVQAYVRAFQVTGKPFYKGVAEETLEYILREMAGQEGGFYSAQDADTEGVEGKFFVWSQDEIIEILGERDATLFGAFYDVSETGNWEEQNILHVIRDARSVAQSFNLPLEEVAHVLDTARMTLWREREKRVKPALDDKVITAWNGLMLAGMAECALVFQRNDFLESAIQNARFFQSQMMYRDSAGHLRLYRTWRQGRAKGNGYLEDYACYAEGLLWLYEATGEFEWLEEVDALLQTMFAYFWDEERAGFFTTSSDHEALIHRPKDWDDNAVPSGNSVAMDVLVKMSILLDKPNYRVCVEQMLNGLIDFMQKHPYGFARVLSVVDFFLASPKEIALLGDRKDPATQELLLAIYGTYLPNRVIAFAKEETLIPEGVPLLAKRGLREGRPTAYVCTGLVCKEPSISPEALLAQLR